MQDTVPETQSEPPAARDMAWLWLTLPVALIALCAELGYAVINNSALPVYLVKGLRLEATVYTGVMVPFFLSEVLFKGPLGVLADKWGRKPLIVFGSSVTILTPLALVSIHCLPGQVGLGTRFLFGALRLLDGLGASALWPALFAYVGDVVRREKRASAMSLLNVTYMVGLAFGFLAGGFVNDTFGPVLSGEASLRQQMAQVGYHLSHPHRRHHRIAFGMLGGAHDRPRAAAQHPAAPGGASPGASAPDAPSAVLERRGASSQRPMSDLAAVNPVARYFPSFYLGSVLFALATITALLAIRGRSSKPAALPDGIQETTGDAHGGSVTLQSLIAALRSVPDALLLAFVTFFGIGCIVFLVKIFALDEFGLTETDFATLILIPALVIGLLAIPLGRLSDAWGNVRSIRLGFSVGALSMWALLAFYRSPSVRELALVVAGGLLGLGFVVAFPAWLAYLTTLTDESHRGAVIGAASTAQGLGVLLGALLGGWLYDHAAKDPQTSHAAPFLACALFLSLGAILTFLVLREPRSGGPAPEPARP